MTKLPHARARSFETELITASPGERDRDYLLVTVCEDEEGQRPMGTILLHLASTKGAEHELLQRLFDRWVEEIAFRPLT